MKKYFYYLIIVLILLLNSSCYGQNNGVKVYDFYDMYSILMNNRGYKMSVDKCYAYNNAVFGEYSECNITNNVYLTLMYDDDYTTTAVKVLGYQKKAGNLNNDTDVAFRVAYSCFYSDTRETTYQNWIKNIKYGMEIDKTYTVNGISAIWGEGLMTGKGSRNGQYYYQITFFLDNKYIQ